MLEINNPGCMHFKWLFTDLESQILYKSCLLSKRLSTIGYNPFRFDY